MVVLIILAGLLFCCLRRRPSYPVGGEAPFVGGYNVNQFQPPPVAYQQKTFADIEVAGGRTLHGPQEMQGGWVNGGGIVNDGEVVGGRTGRTF